METQRDGRRCFRVELMMKNDGMFEMYDIDPTLASLYTPPLRTSITGDVNTI